MSTEGQSSCMIALRYALNAQTGRRAPFIPRCRADGTYAAVQCAAAGAAAGCWCVTPDGKPLPDTAVRNGRPECTRTGKRHLFPYLYLRVVVTILFSIEDSLTFYSYKQSLWLSTLRLQYPVDIDNRILSASCVTLIQYVVCISF
jgi:hypothetical protein